MHKPTTCIYLKHSVYIVTKIYYVPGSYGGSKGLIKSEINHNWYFYLNFFPTNGTLNAGVTDSSPGSHPSHNSLFGELNLTHRANCKGHVWTTRAAHLRGGRERRTQEGALRGCRAAKLGHVDRQQVPGLHQVRRRDIWWDQTQLEEEGPATSSKSCSLPEPGYSVPQGHTPSLQTHRKSPFWCLHWPKLDTVSVISVVTEQMKYLIVFHKLKLRQVPPNSFF